MKQFLIITVTLFSFSLFTKSQENKITNLALIDVESGLKNLSRLKTSDFGKTIRYIPLETPDDGLIGKNPIIKVLRNYIIVEYTPSFSSPGTCLLFSKEDGRFITKIGHTGQDPSAYTDHFCWTDEKEEFLYFERKPNQLIKYDMKGNFCGKVEFHSSRLASYYLITDSEIIGFFDGFNITNLYSDQYALGIFEKKGSLKYTIPSFFTYTTPITEDIHQMNYINGKILYDVFGNWTRAGAFIFEYTSNRQVRQVNALHAARIWKNNESIRYKQDFIDTIYTVSGEKLIPSIIFNTGKYHWPVQERRSEKDTNERVFIADISENNNFIFFQCIRGMFSLGLEGILYNGLYNKRTGRTIISQNKHGIQDDLTYFMPFRPLGVSTSGEFISFVEVWEVMDWLEKHPEVKNNKNLSFLKNLDEEMNPIVILIE